MWITRAVSLTNFAVASSALGFQVFVLYPWHKELDESFEKLKKEHIRVLENVKDTVAKQGDDDSRRESYSGSILQRIGIRSNHPTAHLSLSEVANAVPVVEDVLGPASLLASATDLPGRSSLKLLDVSRYALAGAICCSFTHAVLTPVDVVKTRIQLDPSRYRLGLAASMRGLIQTEGASGVLVGFSPTVVGYFLQGAFKFGGYEFFKSRLNDRLGPEAAVSNRNVVYLASSATAEFLGDILLCPFEAVRIRLVSQPGYAPSMLGAFARMSRNEGLGGLYSGFMPIVLKQVPYTMATFVVYEKAIELAYSWIDKATTSSLAMSGVNLGCGLIAGMAAAVASQPADTVLSKINQDQGRHGHGTARRIYDIVSVLGFRGVYRGLRPRLVMVGAMTALQFGIYGHIQRALGTNQCH